MPPSRISIFRDSDSVYRAPGGRQLPREGLRTFNPSLSMTNLLGLDGLWFKGSMPIRTMRTFRCPPRPATHGLGIKRRTLPWRPALSYRYSLFTGDDPTRTDLNDLIPFSPGALGNFLPGIVFSKVYKNSNLLTHRVDIQHEASRQPGVGPRILPSPGR